MPSSSNSFTARGRAAEGSSDKTKATEPVIVRISADGRLLIEQAIGWIELTCGTGFRSWKGRFVPPRGEQLAPGGPYLLETTDGRGGRIMIEPPAAGARADAEVAFTGAGPFE